MITVLWISNAVFFLTSILFAYEFVRYRNRLYASKNKLKNVPDSSLPIIKLSTVHSCFTPGPQGYSNDCEVSFMHLADSCLGGTTDHEAWIISVLAKHSRYMFEFGTCTGKTTYHMARNSAPDAKVVTITLAPMQLNEYKGEKADSRDAEKFAIKESAFEKFVYSGTDVESKVFQIYGDSKKFDETPYLGKCDLIFIDGSHAYSYVKSDTEKSFRMLKPGGIILWHDFYKDNPSTLDVYRYLNELRLAKAIFHIQGTSLAYFKAD